MTRDERVDPGHVRSALEHHGELHLTRHDPETDEETGYEFHRHDTTVVTDEPDDLVLQLDTDSLPDDHPAHDHGGEYHFNPDVVTIRAPPTPDS